MKMNEINMIFTFGNTLSRSHCQQGPYLIYYKILLTALEFACEH